jgi:hypothetical protein
MPYNPYIVEPKMEKLQCLVCSKEMVEHHKIAYVDYTCHEPSTGGHQLSLRIVYEDWMDGSIEMRTPKLAKLRLAFYKERLHLKVHYDDKYSEVWAKVNSPHRIRINQVVSPDFSNIDKLKNKIKTLLVFG